MADLEFNCPHCNQSLKVPEEMLGQPINCPSCNGAIALPDPEPKQTLASSPQPKPTRACPFCGEEILLSAVKCKHCSEFLDGRHRQVAATPAPEPKRSKPQVENDVWTDNPSYLHYLGHFIFFGILLPLGIMGALFIHAVFSFLGLLGTIGILCALLDRNTKVYTLTNKRAMCKTGIVSRQIHEVGTKDIRNINIQQGIFARLFGLGTVEIESAAAAGQGHVRFVGVKDPLSIRDLIRREKDEADSR